MAEVDLEHVGYEKRTAIDFSVPLISRFQSQHPSIKWEVMDIRSPTFPASSFDVCIDKAALDAMLYGSLRDPEPEVAENVRRSVDEVARVLKPGGLWLYITWRQPHFIRPPIRREGVWRVEVEPIGEGGGMLEDFGFVVREER
jgi:EEF1A lysine methyltransferase 4